MVTQSSTENNDALPELLTMRQTADLLKVHYNTLRAWDKKGILKAVRFGSRRDRKYKKEDVLKLLEKS